MSQTTVFAFRIDQDMAEDFDDLVSSRDTNRTELLREVVKKHLYEDAPETRTPTQKEVLREIVENLSIPEAKTHMQEMDVAYRMAGVIVPDFALARIMVVHKFLSLAANAEFSLTDAVLLERLIPTTWKRNS